MNKDVPIAELNFPSVHPGRFTWDLSPAELTNTSRMSIMDIHPAPAVPDPVGGAADWLEGQWLPTETTFTQTGKSQTGKSKFTG